MILLDRAVLQPLRADRPAGPVEGTPYDPVATGGPSARFYDFVDGAHLMQRGYTFVMVDLRGFGGSSGCLDWGGPGEQADVKAAVEWAAAQPWSTGKVGMYGKSYDGVTGLMGIAQQPRGLAAVVAQEPVYDMYRYLYSNRVRFENSLATPPLYDAIAGTPGTAADELAYNQARSTTRRGPGCPVLNWLDQQQREHDASYWQRPRPDRRDEGQGDAAVPHAGLPREQHEARRRLGPLQRPDRPEARLVRDVGPRAGQRHGRERAAAHGPQGRGSTRSCASSTAT